MSPEAPKNPAVRELESLRIARAEKPPKRSPLIPAAVGVVVLGILAGVGYVVYQHTLGRPLEVQTADVIVRTQGQPGVMLTGSGYIVTGRKYIVVGTKLIGKIVAEPIEEGQAVRKGQILARIDDGDYRATEQQGVADRDLAAANVKLDEVELHRDQRLRDANVISQDSLDQEVNKLEVDKASEEKAVAEIDYAKYYVDQCVIRSPINGVVLTKYKEMGDTVSYASQANQGSGATDIVQLADTDDMRAEVDINESDIARVDIGTPATVIPDSYPDRSFEARLVKVYPAADRQKGTVKIEVHILHPDLKIIKPELSVKVTFLAGPPRVQGGDLVIVPKKAVVGDAPNQSVWIVRDGAAQRLSIVTGREFQDGFEVKSGLSGGETVIVVPPTDLKEGQQVIATAA
jgi:RND family efflux transporter MFP subunit